MKVFLIPVLISASAFLIGCARHGDAMLGRTKVSYLDRNSDGKVDAERHHYPKMADADWELRDDDYDGRYERKIRYGYAVEESRVDVLVPTGLHHAP